MKKLLLMGLILTVFYTTSKGQDTLLLNLEEAVEIGLQKNQAYRIKINEQELIKTEKQAALFAYFPRVNINNSLSRQSGQQFQQVEGEIIVTSVNNNVMSSGLSAGLPIYNGGRLSNNYKAARLMEEAGQQDLNREAQEVVFQVAQQYLQVLLDEELHELALQNLENQKEQLRQIEGFVEVGLNTLSDQYNQQSEVARLETVALNAKIQLETDLWAMAELLQLEPNVFPKLEPVNISAPQESEFLGLDLEPLYEMSFQNRTDYKAQQLREDGAKRMAVASRAGLFPQVGAFLNYNTFYTSLDTRTFSDQFLNIYPQMTMGFNVSIPIFNNFNNKLEVARSRMNWKNRQLETDALERSLNQETKMANENFKAAIRRQQSTQIQLNAAAEAQLAIQEKFKLGLSNFVDLAQANQQLATAQSDHAQATYTLYFQEILMKYTLGIL
ncbi:MAG TPA: TolC family protein [Cyclobacteriaceae bacterium]|nr:TolC family protein [Cyclobacteriaceae bacterium]